MFRSSRAWWLLRTRPPEGGEPVQVTRYRPRPEDRPLISPDGSRVAYDSLESGRGALYVVDTARPAMPRRVCDDCGSPMDWTGDGRWILYGAGEPPRLWLLDVESGRKTDLVPDPQYTLLEAAFSPEPGGPGWVALVAEGIGPGAVRGFVAPFRDGSFSNPREWIPVSENTQSFSLQWSLDGNTLYSLAVRDDFRCLWAHPLEPATKRPLGEPAPVHHFHQEQRYP
jgi:hypothetical protein